MKFRFPARASDPAQQRNNAALEAWLSKLRFPEQQVIRIVRQDLDDEDDIILFKSIQCVEIRSGETFINNPALENQTPFQLAQELTVIKPPLPNRTGETVTRTIFVSWAEDPNGWSELYTFNRVFSEDGGQLISFDIGAVTDVAITSRKVNWIVFEQVLGGSCIDCWVENRWYRNEGDEFPCWEANDIDIVWDDGQGHPGVVGYRWQAHYHAGTEAVYLVSQEIFSGGANDYLRICKYDPPKFSTGGGNIYTELPYYETPDDTNLGDVIQGSTFTRSVLLGDNIYVFSIKALGVGPPSHEAIILQYSIPLETWTVLTNSGAPQDDNALMNGFAWTDGTDLFYCGGYGAASGTGGGEKGLTYKIVVSGGNATWTNLGHAMATVQAEHGGIYDPSTGNVHVFGGTNDNDRVQTYDGSSWSNEAVLLPFGMSNNPRVVLSGITGTYYVFGEDNGGYGRVYLIEPGATSDYQHIPEQSNWTFAGVNAWTYAGICLVPDLDNNGYGDLIWIFQGIGNAAGHNYTMCYSPLYPTYNPFTGDVSTKNTSL